MRERVDFHSALMHMLCLITYKVRSENGYGFLRPGLKTGVGNGIFGLKLALDVEMRAAHPHQKFQGVPPGGISACNIVNMCFRKTTVDNYHNILIVPGDN